MSESQHPAKRQRKNVAEVVQKVCHIHGLTEYYTNSGHCKKCDIDRSMTAFAQCKKYRMEWRQQHPCVDCGISDWRVLQFDHVRGEKLKGVAIIQHMPTLVAEVSKCVSRCCNCHYKRSYEQKTAAKSQLTLSDTTKNIARRRRTARNLDVLNEIKAKIGCEKCGCKDPGHPQMFVFNHRETLRHLKSANVSFLAKDGYALKVILRERYKCEVLCGNCHTLFTLEQTIQDTKIKHDPDHPAHSAEVISEADYLRAADELISASEYAHLV